MAMKPINVTIPHQMLEKLNELRKATGLTLSELIRRSVDSFLVTDRKDKTQTA